MINYILILFSFFTLISCSSVDQNVIKNSLPNGTILEANIIEKDYRHYITLLLTEPHSDSIRNIFLPSIEKILIKPEYSSKTKMDVAFNTVINKSKMSVNGIFVANIVSNVVLFVNQTLNISNFDMNELIALQFEIKTKSEVYKLRITKEALFSKKKYLLKLIPIVISQEVNKIELGVFAYRYTKPDEEYIPNSELMRMEVINLKDKPIYNSQNGANFMQVIAPVYPENIGDMYIYSQSWDFKDNEGSTLIPGKYTISLTIPALPRPYRTELIYERK